MLIDLNCHSRAVNVVVGVSLTAGGVLLVPLEKNLRPLTQQPKLKPHFASSFNCCHLTLHISSFFKHFKFPKILKLNFTNLIVFQECAAAYLNEIYSICV